MTAHTCTTVTPGCYRCELNQDEIGIHPDTLCSCGDSTRKRINHRKTIPCWTYIGTRRFNVNGFGEVVGLDA